MMMRTRTMRKKTIVAALCALALVVALGLTGCSSQASQDQAAENDAASTSVDTAGMDFDYTNRDQDASWVASSATTITLSNTTATVSGSGATVDGSNVTIDTEGTYVLKGTLDDGQVAVKASDDAKVQIVLADASIHNETGPALYIQQADKCFVTLAEGTTNTLTDGVPGGRTGQPPALITPLTFLHRFSSFPLSAGAVRRCGTRYAAYLLYTSGFSTPM